MRPNAQGKLRYYQIATDIESDERIIELMASFPDKGYEVYTRLLTRIYGGSFGYFLLANQFFIRTFANDLSIKPQYLEEIFAFMRENGLINRRIYDQFKIVTSHSIQKKYMRMAERREILHFIKDICLLRPSDIVQSGMFYWILNDVNRDLFTEEGRINPDFAHHATAELINPNWSLEKEQKISEKKKKKGSSLEQDETVPSSEPPVAGEPEGKVIGADFNPSASQLAHEEHMSSLRKDIGWKQTMVEHMDRQGWPRLTIRDVDNAIDDFSKQIILTAEYKSLNSHRKHFLWWYPKRLQYLKDQGSKNDRNPNNTAASDSAIEGQRSWGSGI